MVKLDRYILSQLMGPFAVFSLILVGIYWLARAVGVFDELIADGRSVGTFLHFMILFLPQVVVIVLPIVSFAAAIYVSNRLHSDSEMVVIQSAGLSDLAILRPFLVFGLLVALLAGALSHYLVPTSLVEFGKLKEELAQDMATRMVVGGKFVHPAPDVTFFVADVGSDGSLRDIFLVDRRAAERDVTYTAHKAILYRAGDEARLVMFDGLIQTLDHATKSLSKLAFDEFVFDIATLTGKTEARKTPIHAFSTPRLLAARPQDLQKAGVTRDKFLVQAHLRIEQPFQSLVYPLIAMAVMMLGSFSRFGVVRQVFAAIAIVAALSTLAVPLRGVIRRDVDLAWLIYVPDLVGLVLVAVLLRRNMGRGRRSRRAGTEVPA